VTCAGSRDRVSLQASSAPGGRRPDHDTCKVVTGNRPLVGGLQHLTAVQVDQSGNVWLANNWRRIAPTVGDGLVELIGAAPPVATPMIGPPVAPGQG
jgi:hypothetical protein